MISHDMWMRALLGQHNSTCGSLLNVNSHKLKSLVTVLLRFWRQEQPENGDVTINRNRLSNISAVFLETISKSEELDLFSDPTNDTYFINGY